MKIIELKTTINGEKNLDGLNSRDYGGQDQ